MIKHMFKFIWHRKRSNALILLEMIISFLILYAIASMAVFFYSNAQQPMGFQYRNTWSVAMQFDKPYEAEMAAQINEVVKGARQLELSGVEAIFMKPFYDGAWQSTVYTDQRSIFTNKNAASDGFAALVELAMVEGRWFSHLDDDAAAIPVTINQHLARDLFGGESALGKSFYSSREPEKRTEYQVIGVFEDFRQFGELAKPRNYMFFRYALGPTSPFDMKQLAVKVLPGTEADFEETLMEALQRFAPHWTFTIQPWTQMRKSMLLKVLTPAIALAIIGCFMLLMVGLGLFGVLWQSVAQRRSEIGLRRAMGASAFNISRQIVLEMLVLTGLAVAVGLIFAVQVPLLQWFPVPTSTYIWGMVFAAFGMAGLSCVCALYPAWLASRIQPAEALHYE